MNKWEEKKLGEVCSKIDYGYTTSALLEQKGSHFLRITDIVSEYIDWSTVPYCKISQKNFEKYKLNINDIIIARTGATSGYNQIIKKNVHAVFASYLIRFEIQKANYCPVYISYCLKTKAYKGFIDNYISGAAQPGINASVLSKFKMRIPSFVIQKRIADILSNYDDLIENNNRRIALLEKAAQNLYKEWFVRFRFPGHEHVNFENGLPQGWEVKKLGEIVEIKGGKRLPVGTAFSTIKTNHPYIRIRDISNSKYVSLTNKFEYIDDNTFHEIERFITNTGDILISIVGTIGSICCVGKSLNGANLTENCVKLVNEKAASKCYIYHFLNSETGKSEIYAGIVGSTQPKLPLYNIKRIKLIIPDNQICDLFTSKVDIIDLEIMNLQQQNENLKKQRDLLLPRLMSGRLEV